MMTFPLPFEQRSKESPKTFGSFSAYVSLGPPSEVPTSRESSDHAPRTSPMASPEVRLA